jgi:predicted PurR-regulated permease PerM
VSIVSEAREKLKVPDSALLPAILVMATLYFGREVFVPLALAALLAFLLVPVSALLERWGMRRTPAGLLVVFLSLVAVTSLGWIMLGQIYNLAVELPQYQQNINQKIESLHLHSAGRLSNTSQCSRRRPNSFEEMRSQMPHDELSARRTHAIPSSRGPRVLFPQFA